MKINEILLEELDVKELTTKQLAAKHNVSLEHILSQLKMGIKVEKEHTTNQQTAKEIALDHLSEDPYYYTKLKKANLEETITTINVPGI